jgi:MSHA pilin protein MshA
MQRKKILRSQKGFTLIEIIAVLVILGILAAVAIPKYQGLQDEANRKAASGGVSAGQGACSMSYAKLMLQNGTASAGAVRADVIANPPAVSGGLTITFGAVSGTSIPITGTMAGQNATGTWTMP